MIDNKLKKKGNWLNNSWSKWTYLQIDANIVNRREYLGSPGNIKGKNKDAKI